MEQRCERSEFMCIIVEVYARVLPPTVRKSDVVQVLCDPGFSGGGTWTCEEAEGAFSFSGTSCVATPAGLWTMTVAPLLQQTLMACCRSGGWKRIGSRCGRARRHRHLQRAAAALDPHPGGGSGSQPGQPPGRWNYVIP